MIRKKITATVVVVLCFGLSLVAQAVPVSRAALVIGNSAYKASPLPNPVNDATDIAASLIAAGFEVLLRTDVDLAGMDLALSDFQKLLKGRQTALFYYAGHGVQVEGENYLIPIKEDIQSTVQAKSKAVALGDVLDRVKNAGVSTALVFLDACRDNPFPGASRSGTRGLAVVATPADVETCIAYATQPGNTAQDGSGRNGVFTAAMLKNIGTPGVSLSDLMTSVIADVKSTTGGKQVPRVDLSLSRPFYFIDPAMAAARTQAALEQSKAELAILDAALAELQKRIAASSDGQARQKLQVEQQRQQALQQAKFLEAGNLARESEKQRAAGEAAAKLAVERAEAHAASLKAQEDLSSLAVARRAELDRLSQAAVSEDPDVLIETVERLDLVLREVDSQYAAVLQRSLDTSTAGWEKQRVAFAGQHPEMTESDAEFASRIAKEKSDLEAQRAREIGGLKATIEAQRKAQTAALRTQFNSALQTLETRVWTVTGRGAILTVGKFDRNAKVWLFSVDSADPTLPMYPVSLSANLDGATDTPTAIITLDAAVKANALMAEFDWGLTRAAASARYTMVIRAVRVRNLTTNAVVAEASTNQRAVSFIAGKQTTQTAAIAERKSKMTMSIASWATGAASAVAAGVAYALGADARHQYGTATDSATAASLRTTTNLYGNLFGASLLLSGGSLVLASVLWFGGPSPLAFSSSSAELDRQIKALK